VYADVGVATLYAYLLFTIEPLIGHPDGSLTRHLVGYPLVFGAYLLSGLLRQWTHGRSASKRQPLIIGFVAYAALVLAYHYSRPFVPLDWRVRSNAIALVGALGLMWGYRAYRRYLVRSDERAAARLIIGFDVDGVLADQIAGVLPIIKERHDVTLTYADISDWRLPIKGTDIAQEIVRAQQDREYVLGMRVHEGARRILDFLHETHRIVVITARQGEAATTWTAEWLRRNKLPYDDVVGGMESRKSEHRADVLVDDYIGNVVEFLTNTNGLAVLVDQPWNRDRSDLVPFVTTSRLFVVSNLLELRRLWPDVLATALARRMSRAQEPGAASG
jgi:5'(3')-deoxyribonucleotidase